MVKYFIAAVYRVFTFIKYCGLDFTIGILKMGKYSKYPTYVTFPLHIPHSFAHQGKSETEWWNFLNLCQME